MKTVIWLPIACLVGVIIGAWGPREEIRAMRERSSEQRRQPKNAAAEGFQAFARLANIPAEARRSHRRRPDDQPLFAAATNKLPRQAAIATNAPAPRGARAAVTNQPPRKRERLSPEDLRARIEEAQELWRTRVELARAGWKEKLGMDAAGGEQFDAALDGMNEQIYDTMQSLATLIAQQGKLTPELGLRMMGDVMTIMAETYEKLGACVPDERRGDVSEMQVFEFIDPGVAEPLIAVQDKLEAFPLSPRYGGRK